MLDLAYLPRRSVMELAPSPLLSAIIKGGCQGFAGPLPSAFLDKYLLLTDSKELLQR
jgi:hypothetical protein